MEVALEVHGLTVVNPGAVGCCKRHPADTITCRRHTGGDGRWFFTSWGEPIAPAGEITVATAYVLNYLAVPRVVTASRGPNPAAEAC
jgi:hypothetical protein